MATCGASAMAEMDDVASTLPDESFSTTAPLRRPGEIGVKVTFTVQVLLILDTPEQVSPVKASVKSRLGTPNVRTLTLLSVPAAVMVSVTGNEDAAAPTFELGLTATVPVPLLAENTLLTPEYWADMVCVPAPIRVAFDNVATPDTRLTAVPPFKLVIVDPTASVKVTLPVGVVLGVVESVTVAAIVTVWPE